MNSTKLFFKALKGTNQKLKDKGWSRTKRAVLVPIGVAHGVMNTKKKRQAELEAAHKAKLEEYKKLLDEAFAKVAADIKEASE